MVVKKAEATVITTVLLILLVLATIVIVWQVINRTVSEGSKKIQQQSQCLDLIMDLTKIDVKLNTITIRPSKKIEGYRLYVNGKEAAPEGKEVNALNTVTTNSTIDINAGDEIEVIGKLGEVYCTGGTKKLAEN